MRLFPGLRASSFRITSRKTPGYNCIAWVAGVKDEWWEFSHGYPWPNARREPSVAAAVEVFIGLGFETCDNADAEPEWERIAIYGDDQGYTHAAKQLNSGHWSSKLGKLEDIEHKRLEDLIVGDYGQVRQVMRRRKRLAANAMNGRNDSDL
jgi:hypothetical protein